MQETRVDMNILFPRQQSNLLGPIFVLDTCTGQSAIIEMLLETWVVLENFVATIQISIWIDQGCPHFSILTFVRTFKIVPLLLNFPFIT